MSIVSIVVVVVSRRTVSRARREAQAGLEQAQRALREAEERGSNVLNEAKEEARRIRRDAEREIGRRRNELHRIEQRLEQREQNLENRFQRLEEARRELEAEKGKLAEAQRELEETLARQRQELERISGLTSQEALQTLLAALEKEVRFEANKLIRRIEQEAEQEGQRRAREILVDAIQKCAVSQVAETTVSVVPLPNDDMKGRIIGREGRNIRAFEHLTGVDLIIDDTPEAVVISAFEPKRREIARLALEMLVSDGRIHPARIEEMVEKARAELDNRIREAAESALLQTGVSGVSEELVDMLGSLRYRTSYGQNVLDHAIEVALLCGTMAAELGLNAALARRCGLLHDLGKAASVEYEGTHAAVGAQILQRNGEPKEVVNAAATHHDTQPADVYSVLVQAADALSASRPGSRRESLEAYIQRLQKLEEVANSFEGVEQTYAIQAGREIRVVVNPGAVDDIGAARLARDIAAKIEQDLQYPGQIKVVVTRETRAVEIAK